MKEIPHWSFAAGLGLAALLMAPQVVQGEERSGRQVVESVCAACHAKGVKGAPKIGDQKAWAKRASQGLTSLTEHALKGIREMPAHGGGSNLTDLEIARAVAYMVNQSGGKWVEPGSAKDLMSERSGEQVVKEQCSKCHQDGKGGAPKIGDRAAWKPRLSHGVDALVRSAIRGHGGMPPRGEKADLTDSELRSAILYMYNPSAPPKGAAKPAAAADLPAGLHKTVGGMDVLLGFVSADALRAYPETSVERKMHGGVPKGRDFYHLNVSLLDRASKARIINANVEVRVEQPGMSSDTKKLDPVVVNNAQSYGNYVRLKPGTQYVITVRVRKPGDPAPAEARFDYRQP